jgi:Xaa-Pro aminopeptidase
MHASCNGPTVLFAEPGFYAPEKFGVRLENIVMTKFIETKVELDLYFESTSKLFPSPFFQYPSVNNMRTFLPITLVPFEPHLIKYELLTVPQVS